MRISIWSSYLQGLSPEQMVATFASHGWKCAELSSEHGTDLIARGDAERAGAAFKAFADDHGLCFPQAHFSLAADLGQPAGTPQRRDVLDAMKRWCDMFVAIGVRAGVLHPGGERLWSLGWSRAETTKCSAEALGALVDHVAGGPLVLCLENSWQHEDTMQLVDQIASPALGTCMDTGHLNLTGGNWRNYIAWAGSRLKALHITDNRGSDDDHILPHGRGNIDWTGFADALRAVDYQGLFNFEVPGESGRVPLNIRLAKLDYIKNLAQLMLEA